MTLKNLLLVAVGGGLGSLLRYLCQKFIPTANPGDFPFGTFIVNVLGCFFIGLIYGIASKSNALTQDWILLLTTGFCGGFTTFSAFSYENINLMRHGKYLYPALYISGSVILGLGATFLGLLAMKSD